MGVFNKYSEYYDLLYKDKDYQAEVDYIDSLIKKTQPSAKTILDLGCGTGIHAHLLAKKGYTITGVDFSEDMIAIANEKRNTEYKEHGDQLEFYYGDIREVKVDKKFDVVMSLFHVISYINENDDLKKVFSGVKEHLKIGGSFICDFWYGPGVLSDPPLVRVKKLENENLQVTRIAEPEIHANRNVVDVNYTLFIKDYNTKENFELNEKHAMRYFFEPEFRFLLDSYNFKDAVFYDWLKDEPATLGSWNACLIAVNH